MKSSVGISIYFVFGLFCQFNLLAQDQKLIKDCFIPGNKKHDTIEFGIMLPPTYKNNAQSYPVIYYLHGLNGFYSGSQAQIVAKLFTTHFVKGDIPECIVVFPDGHEGFWCDHYDKDSLLEKEIIDFLIPYVDQNYAADKRKRLIMGWSSGGVGAMYFFSKHPESFKAVISMDGAIISWEEFVSFQGKRPNIFNSSEDYYESGSPNKWIVRNNNIVKEKSDTSIFLTAALFSKSHQNFLSILKDQGIPYKYKELSCNHEFGCVFSETSNDLVLFLSKTLK